MILLDTNIISELMRPQPNQAVIEWLDEQVAEQLFLPAIVKAEIETGIALLDDGKSEQSLLKAGEFISTTQLKGSYNEYYLDTRRSEK